MKNEVSIIKVDFGSEPYLIARSLRDLYLRAPLGLELSPDELALDEKAYHVVASYKQQIIGCVMGVPETHRTRIRQMIVMPEFQKQGIGSLLIHKLEHICYKNGQRQFYLHARQNSVDFYLKNGYQKEGGIFFEIGIAHQVMVKFF